MDLKHTFNNKKISIIGSGFVGTSIAYALMLKDIAREIVLIDINENLTKAEALDMSHGIPEMGSAKITSGSYSEIKDSDLIIITAGRNRQPNETRLNMSCDNIKTAKSVSEEIKKYYTRGVILIVSNPVDIITYKISKWLNLAQGMVFGTGCILDSSRFVNVIANYVDVETKAVNATVIGEHGDSQVQLWSKVTVNEIPIKDYCNAKNIEFTETQVKIMEQKVLNQGTEIIQGKGKTNYGIATCVCHIANAILDNKKIIASVTSILNGEYGINNVALSLPCIISSKGIEKILIEKISDEEYSKLQKSALMINEVIDKLS